jgi:hypothetical protein
MSQPSHVHRQEENRHTERGGDDTAGSVREVYLQKM